MQVILTQNVPHVGALGDQVHVKDGFARNYLLPRGLAIAADSKNAREIQHRRKRLEQLRQAAIASARAESERVTALPIVIKAKAGAGGKLFGSVTTRDLQAAFAEQGVTLERKAFVLHSLVKHTGNFAATVRLHTDVKVDVSFKVESMDLTPEERAALEAQEAATKAVEEAAAKPTEGALTEAAHAEGGASAEGQAAGKPARKSKSKGADSPEAAAAAGGADAQASGKPKRKPKAGADGDEKPKGKGKKKDD